MFEKFVEFVGEMGRQFPDATVEPIERAALLVCAALLVVADRQLERQERKLDSLGPVGPTTPILRRSRAFRLLAQIQKLRAQLAQPELML